MRFKNITAVSQMQAISFFFSRKRYLVIVNIASSVCKSTIYCLRNPLLQPAIHSIPISVPSAVPFSTINFYFFNPIHDFC